MSRSQVQKGFWGNKVDIVGVCLPAFHFTVALGGAIQG